MTNIVNYANSGKESKQVSGYLHNLSNYNNIPRKKAKFLNFAKSCLKIHDETMITQLWNAIEMANKEFNRSPTKSVDSQEDQTKEKTEETGPRTSNGESDVAQPPSDDKVDDTNNDSSSESSKKKKKKRKVEEAVAAEPTPEELSIVDETLAQGDEPSKKKKKKDKKQKSANEEESEEQVQLNELKVEGEVAEKTDSDKIAGEVNTETTNEEPRKKDKKKKKQKAIDDSTIADESIPVDTLSTSGPEVENQDANASQADQKDSDAEAGEPSYSKGGKFKWMKAIKNFLKEQEDKKLPLKKLQKKIFKLYESSCQENDRLTKLSKEDCFTQVEKFLSESGKRKQDRKIKVEDGMVVWKVA